MSLSLESVVEQHLAAESAPPVSDAPAAPIGEMPSPDASFSPDVAVAPEATPEAPAPSSLSDDTVLDLTIDGQPVQMTLAEAKRNISLHTASTKRFQDAAEQRKAADTIRQQAEQAIAEAQSFRTQVAQMLRDPQKLSQLVAAAQAQAQGQPSSPAQPQQPQFDANTLREFVAKTTQDVFHQQIQQIQTQAETARVHQDLDSYVGSLTKDHPVLSKVPGFAEHVYGKALQAQPSSVAQAKDLIAAEIASIKASLGTAQVAQQKAAATAKAAAVNATERGGSPVLPGPKTYNGLNDPARIADIEAFVQSSLS